MVETEEGMFRAGDDFLNWSQASSTNVSWSEETVVSAELRLDILEQFRGDGLLWSRLITDLHTGRLFGRHGEWLMDGAAVVLLLLVVTGLTVARVKRY